MAEALESLAHLMEPLLAPGAEGELTPALRKQLVRLAELIAVRLEDESLEPGNQPVRFTPTHDNLAVIRRGLMQLKPRDTAERERIQDALAMLSRDLDAGLGSTPGRRAQLADQCPARAWPYTEHNVCVKKAGHVPVNEHRDDLGRPFDHGGYDRKAKP